LARRNGQSGPLFAMLEGEEAKALARIFLGEDPDFVPMTGFNAPGGIDEFMRENASVTDETAELAVANTLLGALVRLLQILSTHDGEDPELWSWKVEALCQAYEQLFLGIAS